MLALMSVFLLPREASCRLSGEGELRYVNFEATDSSGHLSSHSLTQRYSVLYDASGRLVNGRLGRYDVALGYEFLTFDTGIKSSAAPAESFGESKGHLFYKGEVLLDPKEIPFRLNIFSRDMNRSSFSKDSRDNQLFLVPSIAGGSATDRRALDIPADTTTGIYGGTHIDSGATLVAGVKNGMTNGYNEILRHFPMLMLDYRDMINKDLGAVYPVDNRLSRLAFVSLNKKDNWFHYRYVTYNDYIDHSNNYNETQVQLGTVDQLLARRWIDFTNWLRVSADGQLTKRINEKSNENFEEFSLNFFATARRESWELRTFNNFTRLNEVNRDRLTYKTSLPLYASGIITPTAKWSAYSKYDDSHTEKGEYFTTVNGGYNVDSFSKSSFTLSHGLSVEQVDNSTGQSSLILTGRVATASSPKFSRDLSLKSEYSIREYRNTNSSGSSNFLDQDLTTNVSYNLTNKLRIMVLQKNRFTSGTSQVFSNTELGATINNAQYQAPRGNLNSGDSGYQSVTTLVTSWIPKPRLNLGMTLAEDIYVPTSGQKSAVSKMSATANYTRDKLKISSNTSFNYSDGNNDDTYNRLESANDVSYIFSRNLDAKIGFTYLKSFGVIDPVESINALQSLNYHHYQANGFARIVFEINEAFTSIEESASSAGIAGNAVTAKQRTNTLLLGAKYFPLRQIMIAAGTRYSFVNRFENDTISYYGSVSAHYQLLEAGLDYTYSKNKTDNRMEKKIMANVKKKF